MLEQHFVVLLVKLAVAAALASILLRFEVFRRTLLGDERNLLQRLGLALAGTIIFASGVGVRVLTRNTYQAVDLGMEGSIVFGMLGGYVTGIVSGVLISVPAMFSGEYLSMAVFAAAGVLGGLLRDLAPGPDAVWQITPFFDYSIYALIRKRPDVRQIAAFSLLSVFVIAGCEFIRTGISALFPSVAPFSFLHGWGDVQWFEVLAVYLTTIFAVILPIKIWNNHRNERKLETQQRSLNEARLAALTRQINPHFLFNTLNSVASLIRTNPDEARQVVYKLSNILRRLLRNTDNLTPLREELKFIDDYLAIEMVRFGDKLRVVKEVDPDTLDRMVPSMLLQPVVENSIRHGLSTKVEGGTIRVKSRVVDDRLHILVEDDGIGIPEEKLSAIFEQGIGVSNVNERLKVLYGDEYKMWIDSKPGEGTRTGLEIPQAALS